MSDYRSDFMRVLEARGFIHQCTDDVGLDALAAAGRVVAYIGFDCTADSLHVGNLMGVMMLRRLQQSGHKPIVLMGGGTTRVGDPSGKDETRRLLSAERIGANMASIQTIFARFLRFGDGPIDAVMVNNADWLDGLNYIDFLRDYGRHFSVNRMLSFDSVKQRLEREQALTLLEFNYMILQAFDFYSLSRSHGCVLQMGGSDQWGNIVNGVELARRMNAGSGEDGPRLYGLTCPLIATASGAKMGKTARGAVWLKPERLSPYDYWQFWRNAEDADVNRFLKLFTDLALADIDAMTAEGQDVNAAKKTLATEATRLCHGDAAALEAAETARRTFEQSGALAEGLPTIAAPRAELAAGVPAFALFVRAGLASSNSEARRLIKGGGGRLNGVALDSETRPITLADANAQGLIKLSAGKKRHALVRAK